MRVSVKESEVDISLCVEKLNKKMDVEISLNFLVYTRHHSQNVQNQSK